MCVTMIVRMSTNALLLMYADDLVLLTTSELHLESALKILVTIATKWGMKLNYGKTKCMSLISRAPVPHATHTSPSPPPLPSSPPPPPPLPQQMGYRSL